MSKPPRKQPNNPPMTDDEIMEMELDRAENKLNINLKPIMQSTTQQIHNGLSGEIEKVSLDDLPTVKSKLLQYIDVCRECSTIPNLTGAARALGHSRQSLYKHMDQNPKHPTTEFLHLAKDAFSELLDIAGLTNSVNPVMAMFLLKCHHSYIDKSELHISTPPKENIIGEVLSEEELEAIRAKYLMED